MVVDHVVPVWSSSIALLELHAHASIAALNHTFLHNLTAKYNNCARSARQRSTNEVRTRVRTYQFAATPTRASRNHFVATTLTRNNAGATMYVRTYVRTGNCRAFPFPCLPRQPFSISSPSLSCGCGAGWLGTSACLCEVLRLVCCDSAGSSADLSLIHI